MAPKPRPRELNTKEILQNGARMSINMKIADFKLMRMYSGYQTFSLRTAIECGEDALRSAAGRHVFRAAWVTMKTWLKPETANEKSLADERSIANS